MSTRASIERTVTGLLSQGDMDDPRAELWDELSAHGVAHPFHGGLSAWSEAGAILSASARFAAALPIAENVVASYILHAAQLELPSARLTVCDPLHSGLKLEGDHVAGTASFVPYAAVSSHAIAIAQDTSGPVLVCFELRGVEARPAENLAREPRDMLRVARVPAQRLGDDAAPISKLTLLGSLARATQLATFSEAVLALSIEHAQTRRQFGRPIAEFQAIRHALAVLAQAVAVARCSVALAEAAVDGDATLTTKTVVRAVARAHIESRCAARAAIRDGHAIHAALGFSFEHPLQRFTTRLMSYRAEFDAPLGFAHWLGRDILSRGAGSLWNDLVSDD
jgi:hypothetical protein